MPFNQLLSAGSEVAINQLLQLDPSAPERLKPLDGKVLALQLRPLPQTFYFVFSPRQVDILTGYEGTPHCRVAVQLAALKQLTVSSQIPAAIKRGELELEGELQVAQHFAQLLGELRIDPEERLSRYSGDIAAHQLFTLLRLLGELINDRLVLLQKNLGEYLREEAHLAPGALEVAYFCDQVEDCRDAVSRLEARINRINNLQAQRRERGA